MLPKAALDRMARPQTMVDEAKWSLGWGLGLELYRRGDRVLRRARWRDARDSWRGLVVQRPERTGAAVLTNTSAGAGPEALALDLAVAALDALPRTPELWEPAAAIPPELEGVLGLWWTEGEEIVLSMREGPFKVTWSAGLPGATSRGSSRTAPTAGGSSKAASAASCSGPCGPRTARSRSSTSRRIRSRATPSTFG